MMRERKGPEERSVRVVMPQRLLGEHPERLVGSDLEARHLVDHMKLFKQLTAGRDMEQRSIVGNPQRSIVGIDLELLRAAQPRVQASKLYRPLEGAVRKIVQVTASLACRVPRLRSPRHSSPFDSDCAVARRRRLHLCRRERDARRRRRHTRRTIRRAHRTLPPRAAARRLEWPSTIFPPRRNDKFVRTFFSVCSNDASSSKVSVLR